MNDFTKAESELVDEIHLEMLSKIVVRAVFGVASYAEKEDRRAAASAVIELVKEALSAKH